MKLNMNYGVLILFFFFLGCNQENEQDKKIKNLEATNLFSLVESMNARVATDANKIPVIELEGKINVWDTTTNTASAFFAKEEENIKGNVWSADYYGVQFPYSNEANTPSRVGSYYSQILEFDNSKNYMITRRGRVCYGHYSDLTNLQIDGKTMKKFNSCIGGIAADDSVTTTPALNFSAGKCSNSIFCGFSLAGFISQDPSVANDDTKVRQSWTDAGYFVSSWSELDSNSITYLCLMGPFATYKDARDFTTSTNLVSVTGSSTKCKDPSGREASPSTFDSTTNRFGYAPFPLKISK